MINIKKIENYFLFFLPTILIIIFPVMFNGGMKLFFMLTLSVFTIINLLKKKHKTALFYVFTLIILLIYLILHYYLLSIDDYDFFITLVYGIITSLFYYSTLNNQKINFFYNSIIIVFVFVVVQSLFEMFFGIYLFDSAEYFQIRQSSLGVNYPVSIFWNVNNLAFFLLTAYFLIEEKLHRISRVILCFFIFFIILATESILGLSVLLFFVAIKSVFPVFLKKNYKSIFISILLMSILFISINYIAEFLYEISISDFFIERLRIIENAVGFINQNNAIYGIGLGGNILNQTISVHNFFIMIYTELGIIGIILFLIYYFILIFKSFTHSKKVFILLILFVITNMMPSSVEKMYIMWIMLGYSMYEVSKPRRKNENSNTNCNNESKISR